MYFCLNTIVKLLVIAPEIASALYKKLSKNTNDRLEFIFMLLIFFQLLCVEKSQSRSGNRTTTSQASAQSRTSQSKTFITEMVQYKENKDKVGVEVKNDIPTELKPFLDEDVGGDKRQSCVGGRSELCVNESRCKLVTLNVA